MARLDVQSGWPTAPRKAYLQPGRAGPPVSLATAESVIWRLKRLSTGDRDHIRRAPGSSRSPRAWQMQVPWPPGPQRPRPPPLTWLVPASSAPLPGSRVSRFSRSAFRAPPEPARRFRGRVLGPKAKPALPAARAGGAHGGVSFRGRGWRRCARGPELSCWRAGGGSGGGGPPRLPRPKGRRSHLRPGSDPVGRRGGRRRTANTKQTAGEGPRSDEKAEL